MACARRAAAGRRPEARRAADRCSRAAPGPWGLRWRRLPRHLATARLALRYAGTGGLAAVVDIGLFHALAAPLAGRLLPGLLLPALLSFLAAALVNFVASSAWAYGQDWRSARRAGRFLLAASLGGLVNSGVTTGLALAGWPATIAKVAGVGIAFGLNFAVNTRWVFGRRLSPRGVRPRCGGACAAGPAAGGRTRRWAAGAAAWPPPPSARE